MLPAGLIMAVELIRGTTGSDLRRLGECVWIGDVELFVLLVLDGLVGFLSCSNNLEFLLVSFVRIKDKNYMKKDGLQEYPQIFDLTIILEKKIMFEKNLIC